MTAPKFSIMRQIEHWSYSKLFRDKAKKIKPFTPAITDVIAVVNGFIIATDFIAPLECLIKTSGSPVFSDVPQNYLRVLNNVFSSN